MAILLVLLYHFGSPYAGRFTGTADTLVVAMTSIGWSGVDLFFVLSGFLITGILLDTRASTNYLSSFFGRRVLRIFPLYYFFLALWFLALPRLGHLGGRDVTSIVKPGLQAWFWAYAQNFLAFRESIGAIGHLWSLAVEEQFYLVWPFVVLAAGTPRRLLWLCLLLALSAPVCRGLMLLAGANAEAVYCMTPCRMDALALGGAVAAATRAGGMATLRRLAPISIAVGVVGLTCLVFVEGRIAPFATLTQILGFSLLAIVYTGLLTMALDSSTSSGFGRLLSMGLLRSFGKYSYAVYVFHAPLGFLGLILFRRSGFFDSRLAHGLFVLVSITASYLLARVSWWALEARFLALKSRFEVRFPEGDSIA